jgi:hypothetical protein
MSEKYKTLKAGDVRQKGDEVRRIFRLNNEIYCPNDEMELTYGPWMKSTLFQPILQSDLMHLEFRRPL